MNEQNQTLYCSLRSCLDRLILFSVSSPSYTMRPRGNLLATKFYIRKEISEVSEQFHRVRYKVLERSQTPFVATSLAKDWLGNEASVHMDANANKPEHVLHSHARNWEIWLVEAELCSVSANQIYWFRAWEWRTCSESFIITAPDIRSWHTSAYAFSPWCSVKSNNLTTFWSRMWPLRPISSCCTAVSRWFITLAFVSYWRRLWVARISWCNRSNSATIAASPELPTITWPPGPCEKR